MASAFFRVSDSKIASVERKAGKRPRLFRHVLLASLKKKSRCFLSTASE
jgi:hypothetical protein